MIPCPPLASAAPKASSADWLRFLRGHPGWTAPIKLAAVVVAAGGVGTDCGPAPSPLPHGSFWPGESGDQPGASSGGLGSDAARAGPSVAAGSAAGATGPPDVYGAGAYGPWPVLVSAASLRAASLAAFTAVSAARVRSDSGDVLAGFPAAANGPAGMPPGLPSGAPLPVPEPGALLLLLPPLSVVIALRRVALRRAWEVHRAA